MSGRSDTGKPRMVFFTSYGSYSDYGVGEIFETREDAEAHVADGGGERVEEAIYWPAGTRPERYTQFRCYWRGPGNEVELREEVRFVTPESPDRLARAEITEDERNVELWRAQGRPVPASRHAGYWLYGSAPTEQDAHKALKDRIAAITVREGL